MFEPLMIITGIMQPLATIPSISKLYFTHSTCFRTVIDNLVHLCRRKSVVGLVWININRKPAIYVGNIIGLATNG